jgi:hypothetical protein
MGHVRLGTLQRTRRWSEVVALIEGGAQVHQVANATIRAAEAGLRRAPKDAGVVETVWLLMHLPVAARGTDFLGALRDSGMHVSGPTTLMGLVGAFADAVDDRLANNRGRTDLGEMVQMAALECIAGVVGEGARSLFETGPEEVRQSLARLFTVAHFGAFASRFFARLTSKCLDYFLSRALSDFVGEGHRFITLAQQAEFSQALETHCGEAAVIVQRFAGEWFSRENWRSGYISRDAVVRFTGGAMAKLIDELKEGAGGRGD